MYMQTERKTISQNYNRRLTIFAVLLTSALLGMLFGALCVCYINSQLSDLLKSAENELFSVRRSGDLSKILLSSFAGTGFYLITAFILGFSAFAQPFELTLPFLRGLGCGVILTQIYGSTLSGIPLLKIAAVLPGTIISMIIIVLAGREAVYMSNRLFKICFNDRIFDGLLMRTKVYVSRFLTLLAASSIVAVIDCVLAILLLGKI
jgi:hypothetical protein